ncbi:hypothetical protein BYT27DRAFT_7198239 [Phlegmacium glaucopus]|nr:hypothetical protein BYT27DRAFT_7198239 [Phlegmacium glaucopus]
MAMFSGKNTLIRGGNFTVVQNVGSKGINRLYEKVAPGAFHNSSERYDPPKCHPGTRGIIIKEIMDWIKTIDRDEFFLWLYGPAGAGKSAIAQTIAELCHKAGLLAASFFFSRTASGRNDATFLIPTLSYQLTISIPEIVDHISLAIERDPLIFNRSLEAQFEALILKPLSTLQTEHNHSSRGLKHYPRLIIIDGLDECNNDQNSHCSILSTLSSSLQHSSVPLIFLVASRPEQDIRSIFNQERMDSMTLRLVLDDHYQPDEDIRLFLISKFKEIKAKHLLALHLPPSWPSASEVENLVCKSSGQFIYASTVIKFVESRRHRPTDRLDIIFGLKTAGKQVPFAELDALYRLIFLSAENIEAVLEVFAFRLLFRDILADSIFSQAGTYTPYIVESFLGYQPGELQIILADLHSVIFVPSANRNSEEDQLQIFHASLGDFLLDRSRSGDLFIDASKAHARMAEICIQHVTPLLEMDGRLKSTCTTIPSFIQARHLEMAYKDLMTQCMKASLTKGLLHQLNSFRFDQYLSIASEYLGVTVAWIDIMDDISSFIRWLQQQCTSHTEGCLCRCYTAHFDNFLLKKLSVLPPLDPTFQCMLTVLTILTPDLFYLGNANIFASNICKQPDPIVQRQLDELRSTLVPERYCLYSNAGAEELREMTRDFFTDQARSKSYYRDKSKYIELAAMLLKYLAQKRSRPRLQVGVIDSGLDQDCSTIAQEILSRFPREPRLVTFLRTNQLRDDVVDRQSLMLTFEAYIKDYDLGNTDAPSSGPESLDPPVHSSSEITGTTAGSSNEMAMYAQPHSPPAPWEQ